MNAETMMPDATAPDSTYVDVDRLPENDATAAAQVGIDLRSHTLAKATLTGLYGR